MYAVLIWGNDDFLTFAQNENGSVKLFDTVKEADVYIDTEVANPDDARTISIDGVMA